MKFIVEACDMAVGTDRLAEFGSFESAYLQWELWAGFPFRTLVLEVDGCQTTLL